MFRFHDTVGDVSFEDIISDVIDNCIKFLLRNSSKSELKNVGVTNQENVKSWVDGLENFIEKDDFWGFVALKVLKKQLIKHFRQVSVLEFFYQKEFSFQNTIFYLRDHLFWVLIGVYDGYDAELVRFPFFMFEELGYLVFGVDDQRPFGLVLHHYYIFLVKFGVWKTVELNPLKNLELGFQKTG